GSGQRFRTAHRDRPAAARHAQPGRRGRRGNDGGRLATPRAVRREKNRGGPVRRQSRSARTRKNSCQRHLTGKSLMSILDRFSLKGKIALVTAGAGPLFGSSLSEGLAEAGATVITGSRSLTRNEEFAAGLRSRGYDATGMEFELGNPDSAANLREE